MRPITARRKRYCLSWNTLRVVHANYAVVARQGPGPGTRSRAPRSRLSSFERAAATSILGVVYPASTVDVSGDVVDGSHEMTMKEAESAENKRSQSRVVRSISVFEKC